MKIKKIIQQSIFNNSLFLLILIFILSRIILRLSNLNFISETLYTYWQYIDPFLLKNRFVESVYYLHSQPPLFNIFLGVVIKIFSSEFFIFHLFNIVFSLTIIILLYKIMMLLNINKVLIIIGIILYIISPSLILYENFLFYTHLTSCILLLNLWGILNFAKNKKNFYMIIYLLSSIALIYIRSIFQVYWFVIIILFIPYIKKINKNLLIIMITALLLSLLPYIKNYALFKSFSTSTWFGMNLSHITIDRLNQEEINKLIKDYGISSIIKVGSFKAISDYKSVDKNFFIKKNRIISKYNIPVLKAEYKKNGAVNFNNINYISISSEFFKASILSIIKFPNNYIQGFIDAFKRYYVPSYRYFAFKKNAKKINFYLSLYDSILFYSNNKDFSPILLIILTFIFIFYSIFSISFLFNIPFQSKLIFIETYEINLQIERKIAIIFVIFNIFYVMLISNLTETWENNRFREMINPYYFLLVIMFINNLVCSKILKKDKGYVC